jgi:hypothetical protein
MRLSIVSTGVIIATMSICTLLTIGCTKENNIQKEQPTIINNYNTYTDSFNTTNNITVQDSYNYENNIDNVQEEVLDSPKTKNPNVCEYCKKEGELHRNIRFWYDTNNNIHYTHNKDCTKLYINEYNIQPIDEMNI